LDGVLKRLRQRKRASGEPVSQRLPVDQLHHQVRATILMAHVVQRADVGVIQA
jgi:hypothetical protein